MFEGLLPVGSVVLLKDSTKKVMIIGFCQKETTEGAEDRLWDYAGCLYPEGYLSPNQVYLFNGEQIERLFAIGYQDEEQFEFKVKVDAVIKELRNQTD